MILIPAQIEGISTRKDKTIRLTIGTQEMNPNQSADLFRLNQQFCYLGIKEEPFAKDEVAEIDVLTSDINKKTPSQRLRGILFVGYEQDNEGYKDFTTYYLAKMEQICNHYKSKLI